MRRAQWMNSAPAPNSSTRCGPVSRGAGGCVPVGSAGEQPGHAVSGRHDGNQMSSVEASWRATPGNRIVRIRSMPSLWR